MARHIYHYNVNAEQRYFLGKHHKLYDLIALNGNIVSHTPAGIAGFIATTAKPFYIDPQTHAFQHPTINLKKDMRTKEEKDGGRPPRYGFKPSITKLAKERLGGVFGSVIDNDKPILTTDLIDRQDRIIQTSIDDICKGTINFQTRALIDSLDEEAKDLIGQDKDFQPEFVIAPYFYLSPRNYKKWLAINISCYETTKAMYTDKPVFLALVISKEALNKLSDWITKIAELKPDGIILWIDDHIEENLLENEVKLYIDLLKKLKTTTGKLYNNHGGYLSILLSHPQVGLLDGVGHSINYGEYRKVIPVGGGIPMARFYFPSVHSRLKFGDALGIVHSKGWLQSKEIYLRNVCRCKQCISLIEEKKVINIAFGFYGLTFPVTFRRRPNTIVTLYYPTAEAKRAATCHYLHNKFHEFIMIKDKSFNELIQNMIIAYEDISTESGDELVDHLFYWNKVLNEVFADLN